jgi:hypothetical protein
VLKEVVVRDSSGPEQQLLFREENNCVYTENIVLLFQKDAKRKRRQKSSSLGSVSLALIEEEVPRIIASSSFKVGSLAMNTQTEHYLNGQERELS